MDLADCVGLILANSAVTEQLQPMRMRLAREQLGGALVHALGTFAAQEAAMVQEELQQLQIARADLPTQEKTITRLKAKLCGW